MQTRSSNARAHPGTKAMEALRACRPKEVIQKEKNEKRAKQEASEKKRLAKEAQKNAGKKVLEQLEAEVAAEAKKDREVFPRAQTQTKPPKRM